MPNVNKNTAQQIAWWDGEEPIRLSCLPRRIPEHSANLGIGRASAYRWATKGIGGVVLRRFKWGGVWCTTKQEIVRWQQALTAGVPETRGHNT